MVYGREPHRTERVTIVREDNVRETLEDRS